MFNKKKKTYGLTPKVRTLEEINTQYNHHAVQYGHKTRIMNQLQEEIEQHMEQLYQLNKEGSALPSIPVTPPPAPEAAKSVEAPQ